MAIEQGLLQLLGQQSTIKSLLPSDVAGNPQIYWVLAPKSAKLPYIVLSRIHTKDSLDMEGNTGLRNAKLQIDCYTDSKAGVSAGLYACVAISNAVRACFDSFVGNLPDTNATAVSAMLFDDEWDMPYTEGATGFEFRHLLLYDVCYYENAVTISGSSNSDTVVQGGEF